MWQAWVRAHRHCAGKSTSKSAQRRPGDQFEFGAWSQSLVINNPQWVTITCAIAERALHSNQLPPPTLNTLTHSTAQAVKPFPEIKSVQTNRRNFFGVVAAAAAATILPTSQAQTVLSAGTVNIVRFKGLTVGIFSALADAQTYVSKQSVPKSYSVEVWPITPAGVTTPLNGNLPPTLS